MKARAAICGAVLAAPPTDFGMLVAEDAIE